MGTKIEWTDETWNPVTGCAHISEGCDNCYARAMTKRLQDMGKTKYLMGFDNVVFHPECLNEPDKWKKPRKVFVCSMSDFAHPNISLVRLRDMVAVMARNERHTFQILTKRPHNFKPEIFYNRSNVWVGVTVENARHMDRINFLKGFNFPVRFISFEPLLGPILKFDMTGIGWIIVGGENGHGARQMDPEWAYSIKRQCAEQNIPFFFKGWGTALLKSPDRIKGTERILNGREWKEFPQTSALSVPSVALC
jgi:protein gp37